MWDVFNWIFQKLLMFIILSRNKLKGITGVSLKKMRVFAYIINMILSSNFDDGCQKLWKIIHKCVA